MLDVAGSRWAWDSASVLRKDGLKHYRRVRQTLVHGAFRRFAVGDTVILMSDEDAPESVKPADVFLAQIVDLFEEPVKPGEDEFEHMKARFRWLYWNGQEVDEDAIATREEVGEDAVLLEEDFFLSDRIEFEQLNSVMTIIGHAVLSPSKAESEAYKRRLTAGREAARKVLDSKSRAELDFTENDSVYVVRWFYALADDGDDIPQEGRLLALPPGALELFMADPTTGRLYERVCALARAHAEKAGERLPPAASGGGGGGDDSTGEPSDQPKVPRCDGEGAIPPKLREPEREETARPAKKPRAAPKDGGRGGGGIGAPYVNRPPEKPVPSRGGAAVQKKHGDVLKKAYASVASDSLAGHRVPKKGAAGKTDATGRERGRAAPPALATTLSVTKGSKAASNVSRSPMLKQAKAGQSAPGSRDSSSKPPAKKPQGKEGKASSSLASKPDIPLKPLKGIKKPSSSKSPSRKAAQLANASDRKGTEKKASDSSTVADDPVAAGARRMTNFITRLGPPRATALMKDMWGVLVRHMQNIAGERGGLDALSGQELGEVVLQRATVERIALAEERGRATAAEGTAAGSAAGDDAEPPPVAAANTAPSGAGNAAAAGAGVSSKAAT